MIPIYIIAYNQYTYVKNMVEQCLRLSDIGKIFIIDNGSTYQPLLNWYSDNVPSIKDVELIKRSENGGSHVWKKYLHLFPDEYIVTDPDLLFNPKMPNDAISILSNIRKEFDVAVVGLALDISDHHNFTDIKCSGLSIHDFEIQYWKIRSSLNQKRYMRQRLPVPLRYTLRKMTLNLHISIVSAIIRNLYVLLYIYMQTFPMVQKEIKVLSLFL